MPEVSLFSDISGSLVVSCDLTFKPLDFPPDFLFGNSHLFLVFPEPLHIFSQLLKYLPVFLGNVDELCFPLLLKGDNRLAVKFSLFATTGAASAGAVEIEERSFEEGH